MGAQQFFRRQCPPTFELQDFYPERTFSAAHHNARVIGLHDCTGRFTAGRVGLRARLPYPDARHRGRPLMNYWAIFMKPLKGVYLLKFRTWSFPKQTG